MEAYRLSKEKSEKELGLTENDDEKAKRILKKISENKHKANERDGLSR